MAKRYGYLGILILIFLFVGVVWLAAQDQGQLGGEGNVIRVVVSMVQLNVAVTDEKGNYVTTLQPSDFAVAEDGIPQKMASYEEGNAAPKNLLEATQDAPAAENAPNSLMAQTGIHREGGQSQNLDAIASSVSGSNVFILFDTSNYMFHGRGFVFAQDSIAEFVRSLDHPYQVAFYSYSRNFYRAASLTSDRSQVIRGVRETTNGDDSALYNALLMTLKDAAQHTGRKVVVVFSNGPDNSSMVSPEDVDELAQSEGIPIYIISTREAQLNAASAAVFARMTASTGGEAYFAKSWKDQRDAFNSIRDDLAHLYFMSYYPQPNPNRGWRAISVKLTNPKYKKYRIRTRSGYRPIPARINNEIAAPEQ
ncbi:MAG TPA: VWA domain-containing protein [Candidatus Acidoferrales bacterium]|jgi:VWFA-related protein|nr:VWA domain-containing protein [Candidatus Acidoferrales bacterium]